MSDHGNPTTPGRSSGMQIDLAVNCGGLSLRTPIMPASGTFSSEMGQVLSIGKLGAVVLKTTTYEERSGNPVPRVSETAEGMLNSIGLPGGGYRDFLDNVLPTYLAFGAPVVVSVSADTVDQFGEMVEALSVPGVAAIELNVSCPNIEADGKAFAMSTSATAAVVAKTRQVTSLPLWAKLTPNTAEVGDIGAAAQDAGADAVVVANTILAMGIDPVTRRPTLGNVMGGLSGPAIKPIIVRMVYQCALRLEIPIVGCGGIQTGHDVVEYLLAGASAVQVGTVSFVDPTALVRIEQELVSYCQEQEVGSVSELIGAVRTDGVTSASDMDVAP